MFRLLFAANRSATLMLLLLFRFALLSSAVALAAVSAICGANEPEAAFVGVPRCASICA